VPCSTSASRPVPITKATEETKDSVLHPPGGDMAVSKAGQGPASVCLLMPGIRRDKLVGPSDVGGRFNRGVQWRDGRMRVTFPPQSRERPGGPISSLSCLEPASLRPSDVVWAGDRHRCMPRWSCRRSVLAWYFMKSPGPVLRGRKAERGRASLGCRAGLWSSLPSSLSFSFSFSFWLQEVHGSRTRTGRIGDWGLRIGD